MGESSDSELVQRVLSGDQTSVGILYTRFWRAARATAFAVTGDWGSAEDAASEGFLQAVAGLSKLRDTARFGAWLRRIVVRNARSRSRPIGAGQDSGATAPEKAPDAVMAREQLVQRLDSAIVQLPAPQREAILLVYFEGYRAETAARFLGVPSGTLRRRLFEGRQLLRRIIEEEDIMKDEGEVANVRVVGPMTYERMRAAVMGRKLGAFPPPDKLARFAQIVASRVDPRDANGSDHPLVAAIRSALPDWPTDSIRTGRGLIFTNAGGGALTVFEALQGSPDSASFLTAGELEFCDVLDLYSKDPLDLHAIQQLLAGLAATLAPHRPARFAPYTEPRYRSALQMSLQGGDTRAAVGGPLASSAGAHIRIFLDPWRDSLTIPAQK